MFVTHDGGAQWQQMNAGLAGHDIFSLAQSSTGDLLAGTLIAASIFTSASWRAGVPINTILADENDYARYPALTQDQEENRQHAPRDLKIGVACARGGSRRLRRALVCRDFRRASSPAPTTAAPGMAGAADGSMQFLLHRRLRETGWSPPLQRTGFFP